MSLQNKLLIFVLVLASQTLNATNNAADEATDNATDNSIEFSTTLSYDQLEETITLEFSDSDKKCKLHAKRGFLDRVLSKFDMDIPQTDSCHFQPTKRVHTYKITGLLKEENVDEEIKGTGKGYILNIAEEYAKLQEAQNIDALFKTYNEIVNKINADLPKDQQLSSLSFKDKESEDAVSRYQKENDLALPNVYIKMITEYGYPAEFDNFIALNKQKSIATIYESGYSYTQKQYHFHKGIEKNKAFFQEGDDVYYIFQDNAKAEAACDGEPLVIYTIATEGDYSPEDLKDISKSSDDCSGFFKFIKGQFVEHFIENINNTVSHVLPLFKKKALKAELTYDAMDDDTLDYYFDYNDIFY